LYEFNSDWNVLLQQNYQNFEAHGYWAEEPVAPNGKKLNAFEIMAFAPQFEKDKYQSTSWTVNGRFGDLKAVYTGSFLDRHIDGQQDYSNYVRTGGSYYLCSGAGASPFISLKPKTCGPPVASNRDQVKNTHESHEFRVQTADDKRLRALAGLFYEDFIIYDNMNFNYLGIPQCTQQNLNISLAGGRDCVAAVGPVAGFYAGNPNRRIDANTGFGEDIRRGYKQTAFFGSVDFDLIPKTLTLTVGTRHYKYDEFQEGSQYSSYSSSLLNQLNGTVNHAFGMNLKRSESGYKSRANLTWHVTPDVLAYYTFSQGFRPGGFNRTQTDPDGSNVSLVAVGHYYADPGPGATQAQKDQYNNSTQYNKPVGYDSDNLINNEVGIKSEWLNHRLQLNASAYSMDWKKVQLPIFDPVGLGNTTFTVNGPSYKVKGLELQFIARVTDALTVQGSSSWNSSNQSDTPCALVNKVNSGPTPVGSCIDHINGALYTNPYGVKDVAPAFSPPLQFNARARYDFGLGEYKAFWSLGLNYTAHFITEPENFPNGDDPNYVISTTTVKYNVPSYTVYDGAFGLAKDNWTVQLTGNNLDNSHAATSKNAGQYITQVVTLRPRTLTLQMSYKF
jgi:outer membrane receptor protein involved in Fe transport